MGDASISKFLDYVLEHSYASTPLFTKIFEWTKAHPVVWNVGIRPSTSFVPTLTRLLFNGMEQIYRPHDHIIHVKLSPLMAGSSTAVHGLALGILQEIAKGLMLSLPDELQQLANDESYYGYSTFSENLILRVFGKNYIRYFGSDLSILSDPHYECQPPLSSTCHLISDILKDKRYLMLIENLHGPIDLDAFAYAIGLPRHLSEWSIHRWLISTTSKDIYNMNKYARNQNVFRAGHHALSFHDPPLGKDDWACLTFEAMTDAACSIQNKIQQNDERFWFHIAYQCLYYGILYHPLEEDAGQTSCTAVCISSDELIRCWVTEGLVFSTLRIKNNNTQGIHIVTYRSAYDAGRVILEALQEYSLLPRYSICGPTTISSMINNPSSGTCTTGMSLLASEVPQLKEDEIFDYDKRKHLRWISFMNGHGRHVSRDWRSGGEGELKHQESGPTTLVLRGYSKKSILLFDDMLTPGLHVLDLSYTHINSLPPSFSCLVNLKLLSLRGCCELETLCPPSSIPEKERSSLSPLEKLEVLDLNGVPLLQLTQQDGIKKSNLHYLDISSSRMTNLPSDFFHNMSNLEELILGSCYNLKELPPSFAKLSNLLILHVEGTRIYSFPEDTFEVMQTLQTLKLINNRLLKSLPMSLSKATSLKELHIYNCNSLRLQLIWKLLSCLEDLYIQTWEALKDIKIHGHPRLRTFSLSGPWIRHLSLRGCSNLKIVNFNDDLKDLEDVDLSATAIEELPHNLPNLPQVRMLLLFNVHCLKRFPWHQLVRFPRVFYLDHCRADDNKFSKVFYQQDNFAYDNLYGEETANIFQVSINDSRIFYSFNTDAANKLVKEGQFVQSFSVQVKPCSIRSKAPQSKQVELCKKLQKMQRQSPYLDTHNSKEGSAIIPMVKLQPSQRHVEISAMNTYPKGLRHLLSVTNSISITEDASITCLTDLNYGLMWLEECELRHCHQMTVVFRINSKGSEVLQSLRILHASHLRNLLSFIKPNMPHCQLTTFRLLKYFHLEHCPRLENIFPCSLSLPNLEVIVILFCTTLKTIFFMKPEYQMEPCPFPNLKRMYFQELPQLQHIHGDHEFQFEMPLWEKLYVRGCRCLRRLPLLKNEYPKSKVEVNAQRDWWNNLQWDLIEQRNYYLPKLSPQFASFNKAAKMKRYLV